MTIPTRRPLRIGYWAAAGTKVSDPYPCRCASRQGCRRVSNPTFCPCYGRGELGPHLPTSCCALRSKVHIGET
jgi:hypothetical protein